MIRVVAVKTRYYNQSIQRRIISTNEQYCVTIRTKTDVKNIFNISNKNIP